MWSVNREKECCTAALSSLNGYFMIWILIFEKGKGRDIRILQRLNHLRHEGWEKSGIYLYVPQKCIWENESGWKGI